MCGLNMVTLQCVSVKLLSMLLVKTNHVWHFADGPLGLVSQTPAHLDQCILYRAEESLFWGNLACSSFSTSLKNKRGVICVLKTICSRVIDPEKSNLSISCQVDVIIANLDELTVSKFTEFYLCCLVRKHSLIICVCVCVCVCVYSALRMHLYPFIFFTFCYVTALC